MSFKMLFLLSFCAAAAAMDVRRGRIKNALIAAGIAAGFVFGIAEALSLRGTALAQLMPDGRIFFENVRAAGKVAAGALVPLLIGFPLFFFRMTGAGDVKLMMAAGAIVGYPGILKFSLLSLLCAAAVSLYIMLAYTGISERIRYFIRYMHLFVLTGERVSYRHGGLSEFHFAVPVLMASIIYCSGII